MKTLYLIGRESGCDVVLWSNSPEISRRHAQIRIDQKGQYWLMDTSLNGTYLNGMRLQPNQEVRVTRKDVISFALQETLDWSLIPKKSKKGLWITLSIVAVLLIAVGVLSVLYWPKDKSGEGEGSYSSPTEMNIDEPLSNDTIAVQDTVKTQQPTTKEGLTTIKVNPLKNASPTDKRNPAEEIYEQMQMFINKSKANDSSTQSSVSVNKEEEKESVELVDEQEQTEQQPTDAIF